MIHYVYSVYDKKALTYDKLVLFPTLEVARRTFQDFLSRSVDSNAYVLHPEDFDVYLLGSFDYSSGAIDTLPNPEFAFSIAELFAGSFGRAPAEAEDGD